MATASLTQTAPGLATLALPALYRMTVDEFERIAGSLDDDHVELIDGYIIGRGEMKPAHALAAELTRASLQPLIPVGWHLREDKPVRIPEFNEPLPDFSVARGVARDYANRHPGPGDVALLIEIADASLPRDRGEKLISYALSGVPVYWIVNLIDRQIEVYSLPSSQGYASGVLFSHFISPCRVPVVIDGAEVGRVELTDLLP
jgi:Uma2 family endonuclease